MTTGIAKANGIDIAYETFGNPNARPLLAVMGLGAQMIAWDDEFMEKLAAHDFHVIRFDNRDTGLSTKIENAPRAQRPGSDGRRHVLGQLHALRHGR